jgi:hypothetical protein
VTVPNFAPGTVVAGKFSIRSLLGYGGASATFHAVSQQGRDIALKAYSSAVGQRRDVMDQLQRYVAETNALPNDLVAPILEAGYDPATGTPFTVTELITLPSVAQLVMHRPMSVDEVTAMMRTLAAVLDAAHARDVFHHALKPTNLFLDPNAPGNLRVIDFGVGVARGVVPTQEGYVVAAPWIAPEQAQTGMPAGATADIFSAALVAFFALTGRSYWRSCQGAPDLAAWQREIVGPRTPASARAAELGVPLSPTLDPVFSRAMAVDPRERFRTMGECAASFGGFPGGRGQTSTTIAFPATDPYAAEPPPRAPPQAAPLPQYNQGGYPPVPEQPMQPMQPPVDASLPMPLPQPTMTHIAVPGGGAGRSPSGKAAPIVVGVAAVLLIGGGVAAWTMLGTTDGQPPGPATSSSTATSAAPIASGVDTPPTGDTAVPQPGSSAAAEDAGAPAAAEDVLVKITCKPEACGVIKIDDKAIADLDAELRLKPGKHKVRVERIGYVPKSEDVVLEAGNPFEKEYTLDAIRTGPVNTGGGTKKPRDCSKLKLLEKQRCERGG